MSSWDPMGSRVLRVTVPAGLVLVLLDARLLNDIGNLIGNSLNDDGRGSSSLCHFGRGGNNVWNFDCALLELGRELLVQKVPDDQDGDDRHDIEDVKGGLGGDFLDDGTFGMVDDWGAHY